MGPAVETATSQTRRNSIRRNSLIHSWEAFDRLFDEAFAPTVAIPQSIPANFDELRSGLSPLTPLTPLAPVDEDSVAPPSALEAPPRLLKGPAEVFSSDDEDFRKLWNEAVARKQRMTKTIVRKRSIHQGKTDMMGRGASTISQDSEKLKRRKSR